jgi:hypothetical protein
MPQKMCSPNGVSTGFDYRHHTARWRQSAFYVYFESKEDAFFEVLRFHSHLIRMTTREARAKATRR